MAARSWQLTRPPPDSLSKQSSTPCSSGVSTASARLESGCDHIGLHFLSRLNTCKSVMHSTRAWTLPLRFILLTFAEKTTFESPCEA